MDDQTEILDECGPDVFQMKQSGDAVLECGLPTNSGQVDDRMELNVVEKELQMLSSFDTYADAEIPASKYCLLMLILHLLGIYGTSIM